MSPPPTPRLLGGSPSIVISISKRASDPQLSPDGTQVLYTRTFVDKVADKSETAVWIVGADGQHHRFLAKGGGAVWAPDGKSIAYLADGQSGGAQIYVLHLDVPGPATQITWGAEAPANLHWSPDGRSLGFSMRVMNPEKWTIDLPPAPAGAQWANTPRFTERLHYRRDHVGLNERGFHHLFLVAADGGAPRQLTQGDWSITESVYEYVDTVDWAFTPDGRSAIVEGFKEGNGDFNDQDCYLYKVDFESGATKRLTSAAGSWRRPAISPDGKTIAYVGFPKNNDAHAAVRDELVPAIRRQPSWAAAALSRRSNRKRQHGMAGVFMAGFHERPRPIAKGMLLPAPGPEPPGVRALNTLQKPRNGARFPSLSMSCKMWLNDSSHGREKLFSGCCVRSCSECVSRVFLPVVPARVSARFLSATPRRFTNRRDATERR